MAQAFVGFYWTLPVNWLGFRDIPKDAEAAAAKSKTIRYQREVIWREVAERRGELVDEIAFIDVEPDRATSAIVEAIRSAADKARAKSATLLMVHFGDSHLWRRIHRLEHLLREISVPAEVVRPSQGVMIDGKPFDPRAHFEDWRWRDREVKQQLRARAEEGFTAALRETPEAGAGRYTRISEWLNGRGIRTPTGRSWSAENVRKILKRGKFQEPPKDRDQSANSK